MRGNHSIMFDRYCHHTEVCTMEIDIINEKCETCIWYNDIKWGIIINTVTK